MADSLVEIFRKELNDDKLDVKVEKLKDDKSGVYGCFCQKKNRRMEEMMKDVRYERNGFGYVRQQGDTCTQRKPSACEVPDREQKKSENVTVICKQLYDLAMLAHKPFKPGRK